MRDPGLAIGFLLQFPLAERDARIMLHGACILLRPRVVFRFPAAATQTA
jgi:hypothetical protein